MRKLAVLVLVILTFVLALPALAAGTYRAEVGITDTSGSDRSGVPVLVPFNATQAVTLGFLSASGLDSRLLESTTERSYMIADDKIGVLIPSLSANQERIYNLETGYSPANSSFGLIVGSGGYVTIADAAALEPANNFEFEQDGYVDTATFGVNQRLLYKQAAFVTYVSAANTITSAILSGETTTTENLLPNAVGDYTNVASQLPASTYHWDKVDDPVGAPDDSTTYVYTTSGSEQKDAYNLAASALPASAIINSVTVNWRAQEDSSGAFQAWVTPYLRLGTSETVGTQAGVAATWADHSQTLAKPGGGAWSTSDLANLQVAIGLRTQAGSNTVLVTQVYVGVTYVSGYTVSKSVSATATASGELVIKTTADGVNLKIYVDAVEKDSVALAGASVPDNANNWLIARGNSLPYMDSYKHTVSGTLTVWYQPVTIISGTTLPDRQGTAQNGTIAWGSNQNIGITSGGLTSIASYTSTPVESGGVPTVVNLPGSIDMYPDSVEITALPYYDLFRPAAIGEPVYNTGTVSGTIGTNTLTGSGTNWTSSYRNNSIVVGGYTYTISSVASPTNLVLTTNLLTSPSSASYVINSPSLQWSTNTLYGVMATFVAIGIGLGVAVATGSALLAVVAVGAGLSIGASTGALGWWVLIVYVLFAGGYLVASRSM